mmetsp:Transcript_74252/g.123937  ORF Transcript_74252/g.123937 Transcript_74252/m.123937 type:complete len:131 (+) Transcript_74252:117-509(+)
MDTRAMSIMVLMPLVAALSPSPPPYYGYGSGGPAPGSGQIMPWGSVLGVPRTGTCKPPFHLEKRLSGHGKCFPDGDPLIGTQIMYGSYGCYPGLNIVWVEGRCSGRFRCENGRTVLCGRSTIKEQQNCTC